MICDGRGAYPGYRQRHRRRALRDVPHGHFEDPGHTALQPGDPELAIAGGQCVVHPHGERYDPPAFEATAATPLLPTSVAILDPRE